MPKNLNQRYQIEDILGQGGMGKVYLACDLQTNKKVAVKQIMLTASAQDAAVYYQRFQREYQILYQLNHPNVIKACDYFVDQNNHYMVLEYVEGTLLKDFIVNGLPYLDLLGRLTIAIQIVKAVAVVNEAGVIHRDIKPSNIMLEKGTRLVKILDLGLAKTQQSEDMSLTKTNTQMGTPSYMSPEQVNGEVAPNSDVFSVAIILHQFFSEEEVSPFHKGSTVSTMNAICEKELPSMIECIDLPDDPLQKSVYLEISKSIDKALRKNPKQRIAKATTLVAQLEEQYKRLFQNQKLSQDTTLLEGKKSRKKRTQQKNLKKTAQKKSANKKKKESPTKYIVIAILICLPLVFLWPNKKAKDKNKHAKNSTSKKQKTSQKSAKKEKASQKSPKENSFFKQAQQHYTQKKYSKALQLYKKSAQAGNADAMSHVGDLYLEGQGVEKDYKTAIKWYQQGIDKDSSLAMRKLAVMYMNGWGVTKDRTIAAGWYRKAADLGNGYAMCQLAILYSKGEGIVQNQTQAVFWFKKSAALGSSKAMLNLGTMYAQGWGIEQSYSKALSWYQKAIKLNNARAMTEIGFLYMQGQGVTKNYKLALEYLNKAVALKDPKAMSHIGYMFLYGVGVKKDTTKALGWYKKATNLGDVPAMTNLGIMYRDQKKYALAHKYLYKASTLRSSTAMYNLGLMYYHGRGIPKNINTAMVFINKAAQFGNKNAIAYLKSLKK